MAPQKSSRPTSPTLKQQRSRRPELRSPHLNLAIYPPTVLHQGLTTSTPAPTLVKSAWKIVPRSEMMNYNSVNLLHHPWKTVAQRWKEEQLLKARAHLLA